MATNEERPTPRPQPLNEDEKALLRRVCRVRKITDHEIEFTLVEPGVGKALWFTFLWFLAVGGMLTARWIEPGPSVSWMLR